jgi:hypothetical protein
LSVLHPRRHDLRQNSYRKLGFSAGLSSRPLRWPRNKSMTRSIVRAIAVSRGSSPGDCSRGTQRIG